MVTRSAPLLVSILINNYNYGRFLVDAIESALAQTYEHCEIIVVDDGSTDGSPEIIERYAKSSPNKLVSILKANGGQASAFNAGFERSRGDIICFLDADDTFSPRKAQRLVDLFVAQAQANPKIGWCFHPIERVDCDLQPIGWDESGWREGGIYDLRSRLQRGKLGKATPFDCLVTSGMCFTRAMLSQLLPMPTDIKITSDDYLKYAALGTSPGYMLMEKLARQRLHGDNAYTGRDEKQALQGKIMLQTAYFLKRDFPSIGAFADNLYALGLAKLSKYQLTEHQLTEDRLTEHQLTQDRLDPPECGHSSDATRELPLDSLIRAYAKALPLLTAIRLHAKKTYYRYSAK